MALRSQRKNSEAAITVTPLPGSSSTLLSQVLKDISVMISSSYKLSKYDLTKPGRVERKETSVNFLANLRIAGVLLEMILHSEHNLPVTHFPALVLKCIP